MVDKEVVLGLIFKYLLSKLFRFSKKNIISVDLSTTVFC